ncbi:MAG: NIPSNAP family protein [Phycisphaerales bacterium]|nr:MAG: NIPSNAP family protein [Phycisphaerales bacterium]
MQRREFLKTSCVTGLATLGTGAAYGQADPPPKLPGESDAAYRQRLARMRARAAARRRTGSGRDFIELRRYEIETEAQKGGMDAFLRDAAIPALNRMSIDPVGVFYPWEGLSPIYVLLRHRSFGSFVALTQELGEDEEFMQAGAAFLDAPAENPAYKRMTSSLMLAFAGMPHLETPTKSSGRVFQLRTYESPSVKTGLKKIEMFNTAEIDIFRKTGLNPVFFGRTLTGDKMPNLTYMLVFNSMDERQANWKRFGSSPEWKALRAIPEYADKKILCGITNLYLKPAGYSQI